MAGLAKLDLMLRNTKVTDEGLGALLRSMPESVARFAGTELPPGFSFDVQGGAVKAKVLFEALRRERAAGQLFAAFFNHSEEDTLMRNEALRTLYMMAQAQGHQNVSEYLRDRGGAPNLPMLLWHSRLNWRTYACVGGAALLGAVMAAIQSAMAGESGRRTHVLVPDSDGEQAGTRRKGAALLAAVAIAKQQSSLGSAGPLLGKALRASEICAHWILFTGPVMYTVDPKWAAAFAALVYGLPAIHAHGIGNVIRRPVLMVVSASAGQAVWALARLLLTCALTWCVYCAGFPQLSWELKGLNGHCVSSRSPVLRWPQPGTGVTEKRVGDPAGSPPFLARFMNPKAPSFLVSQGWFPDWPLGMEVHLGDAFAAFMYAIASVGALWVLGVLTQFARVGFQRLRSPSPPSASVSPLFPRQEVRSLAEKIEAAAAKREPLPEGVTPWKKEPSSPLELGLLVKVVLLGADMFVFDVLSILTMLATENFWFAFFLLAYFIFNVLSELLAGRLQAVWREYEATLATGVPTDNFLLLLETEVGVETFVSIGITAYAFPFCCTSAFSMLNAPAVGRARVLEPW